MSRHLRESSNVSQVGGARTNIIKLYAHHQTAAQDRKREARATVLDGPSPVFFTTPANPPSTRGNLPFPPLTTSPGRFDIVSATFATLLINTIKKPGFTFPCICGAPTATSALLRHTQEYSTEYSIQTVCPVADERSRPVLKTSHSKKGWNAVEFKSCIPLTLGRGLSPLSNQICDM